MTTLQESRPPATPSDELEPVADEGRRQRRTRRALVAIGYGVSGLIVAGIRTPKVRPVNEDPAKDDVAPAAPALADGG